MTVKRYDVIAPSLTGGWVPATLTLDTESSRADTLKVTVFGTRGQGEVLFLAESFAESSGEVARDVYNPPRGYSMVAFKIDQSRGQTYVVASILTDEILRGARTLRRGRPRTPVSRFANDEIHQCVSCGIRVMSRGADHAGWKGIQMHPSSLEHDYYCTKPACVEKRDEAIERAKVNWGMAPAQPEPIVMKDDTPVPGSLVAPVPRGEEAEGEKPVSKYGPPPDKPFL